MAGLFTPQLGETYFSLHLDKGVKVVRRHFWDNHKFDFLMLNNSNCYINKVYAQDEADLFNKEAKSVYAICDNCKINTRHKNGVCMDCKKLTPNP